MARYTGPKTKISRKFGEPLFGEDRTLEKKNYPPGQHGNSKRRAKKSEYAIQLMEKQKAKYTYGILEKQFKNIYDKANRGKGITGELLLQLCESRLDNVVYRMGFATTRAEARQVVNHKSVEVNGKVVNIPSYDLKPGDEVTVREKNKEQLRIKAAVELAKSKDGLSWLEVSFDDMKGKFVTYPDRSELSSEINENLIIELYSK